MDARKLDSVRRPPNNASVNTEALLSQIGSLTSVPHISLGLGEVRHFKGSLAYFTDRG